MKKKKKNGYQVAVAGARGTVKVLIYIFVILVVIFLGRTAYTFGYAIFNENPMAAEGKGVDITITIPGDASLRDMAKLLEDKGIVEDYKIFMVQAKLSKYKEKLKPGTYIINTSKNADQILAIIAKEDTKGQPSEEDKKKATEDSSVYDKVDSITIEEETDSQEGATD